MIPASLESTEIRDIAADGDEPNLVVSQYHHLSKPFKIGKPMIQPFSVFHSDTYLAYRIERNGKVFLLCADHELWHGDDLDFPLQIKSVESEKRLIEKLLDSAMGVPRKDCGYTWVKDLVGDD